MESKIEAGDYVMLRGSSNIWYVEEIVRTKNETWIGLQGKGIRFPEENILLLIKKWKIEEMIGELFNG